MTVLESTCPEDSETHPDCWIWWRFGWDIEGTGKFCHGLTYVWPSISQPNLHQIQQSGGVSESSGHADSKTVIEIQDWPRFHGEKDQNISNR